jgi:C1q domain
MVSKIRVALVVTFFAGWFFSSITGGPREVMAQTRITLTSVYNQVLGIINGTITVGKAEDANTLGGRLPSDFEIAAGQGLVKNGSTVAIDTNYPFNPAKNTGFEVGLSSTQMVSANTYTKLNFTKVFDDKNSYSTSSQAYTVPETGVYQFSANAVITGGSFNTYAVLLLYKNGSPVKAPYTYLPSSSTGSFTGLSLTATLKLVPGDSIDVRVFSPSSVTVYSPGLYTYFSGSRLY